MAVRGAEEYSTASTDRFKIVDPDKSFGMGGFLQGMLGDLLKMVKTDGAIQWDLAVQFAASIASEGDEHPNPEPLDRINLERLLPIAELHVADVSGMTITPDGKSVSITTAGRAGFVAASLEQWRPIIEQIAGALAPMVNPADVGDMPADPDDEHDEMTALITKWASAISPMMLSMQIGSVVGHLSQRVLSQYELLLPRKDFAQLMYVPSNIRSFADDWSIAFDDLALWLIVRDLTVNAILSRAHVSDRLSDLLVRHASGFRPDPSALEHGAGELGMGDFDDLSRLLGDPGALSEVNETPESRWTKTELATLSSTIDGYAEWVTATVVERLSGDASRIKEALRRHRVDRGEETRTADLLFGLPTDQQSLDQGEAFIRGILDRNGERELARLWVVADDLPTPAEFDAPGLWLERVNLPRN